MVQPSTTQRHPRFLKDEIPGLVEQGYEGDVPSMKVPPISNEAKKKMGTMTRGRDHFGRETTPVSGTYDHHGYISRWWWQLKDLWIISPRNLGKMHPF